MEFSASLLLVFGGFDDVDGVVELILEDVQDGLFFVDAFLVVSQVPVLVIRVDNVRTEEDDDIGFGIGSLIVAKGKANYGQAA